MTLGEKKRILIFSLSYFPKAVGGAEIAIKEITDRNPDIEFHMITNRYDSTLPKVEKVGNVLVHRIGITAKNPSVADLRKWPLYLNKMTYQFLAAWKAFMLHSKYDYDGIWAIMAHSTGVPAALFKLFRPSVPYVLTLQEGDTPEYVERLMWPVWPLFTRAFKIANVVHVISTFLGEWAKRRGFTGPLEVIPNAVNTELFSREYPEMTINSLKDSLGKKMGDVFLVTTSRLVHKNAVDVCIKALQFLPENVHLIVLGAGPLEKELQLQATSHELQARVQFVGHVEHHEIPKYLKTCDIFVRPSRSEGMGNSFVEAMAAGLPVIGTQEGGISDFLFDPDRKAQSASYGAGAKRNNESGFQYKTGWVVDKDSSEQVADAVKAIMSNPEKVRAVVATARQMVKEKYDWDLIAKDMRERVFSRLFQ